MEYIGTHEVPMLACLVSFKHARMQIVLYPAPKLYSDIGHPHSRIQTDIG